MRAARPALVLLSLCLAGLPLAAAQLPGAPDEIRGVMDFDVEIDQGYHLVSLGPGRFPQEANFNIKVTDTSTDRPAGVPQYLFHYVTIEGYFRDHQEPRDWALNTPASPPGPFQSGESYSTKMQVIPLPTTPVDFVDGFIQVTMRREQPAQNLTRLFYWAIRVAPQPIPDIELVEGSMPQTIRPNSYVQFVVRISNLDFYPHPYRVRAEIQPADGVTPEDIAFGGTGDYYLQAKESREVVIGFQTPREKTWYLGSPVVISVSSTPSSGQGKVESIFVISTVEGFYISENLLLILLAFFIQLLLVILAIYWLLAWRARNVYGKPIPPWKIPEERTALQRLKVENPRAHYVVRYFLMEEEHLSALLWYGSFKKVSKRELRAQAKVVALRERAAELEAPDLSAFERREARLRRRYAKRIERVHARAASRIERLRARLDRSYERDYEKDHGKWEKRVAKLEAKANKPFKREIKAWERQKAKVLEEYEKPFRKEKAKYEKALAKAKERYAAQVKKKDKGAWKAWREQMEDWQVDTKLRKQEGKEPAPEPELLSPAVAREGFPESFRAPPKPELPPQPKRARPRDLPLEPELAKPALEESHYRRRLRRSQRWEARMVRRNEGELAIALEVLERKRRKAERQAERQRHGVLEEAEVSAEPGLVDRVLRRTPEAQERKHRRVFIRAQTQERIRALDEREAASVERVRIEARRREAELEARIIRARAEAQKAARLGAPDAPQRAGEVPRLEAEREELARRNEERIKKAEAESERRIVAGRKEWAAKEEALLAELQTGAASSGESAKA